MILIEWFEKENCKIKTKKKEKPLYQHAGVFLFFLPSLFNIFL